MSEKYVPPTRTAEVKPKKGTKLIDAQKELHDMYTKLRDILNDQEYDQEWLNKSDAAKILSLLNSYPFEYHLKFKKRPTESDIKTYEKLVKATISDLIEERQELVKNRAKEISKLRSDIQSKMELNNSK
jgi:hypothetical protein